MFPIDLVVQPESKIVDGKISDPDSMFPGQAQDQDLDLDESLLLEVLELSLKCSEVEMEETAATEMETATTEIDIAISIQIPDDDVGVSIGEKNHVKFDIFDETTDEYDEVFSSEHSTKKPAINFCRSISMPYARHGMQSDSGSQQVS